MAAEPRTPHGYSVPLRVVDTLEPAFALLDEFATLEAGWDSYSAELISPVAIRVARGLLMLSAGFLTASETSDVAVRPVPIADGGVQLEWFRDGHELEVEIQADGTLSYLVAESDNVAPIAEQEPASVDDVLEQIRALTSQTTHH